ncbi:pyruvate kinase [Anaerotruncus colihominis]|uniref:Pyruvate kinase n=1 Tax=Anaerotruncus colihominis TaxID=169435 RepID=A0A845T162_9FIRM|nr:pyruvate kinase [Anaerotruncus colihominis]MCR2024706.1 pyruvate kinase [Anaerotruncus colihominis]NDO38231.1 pyruvate kinase [Anaerotruncus colihominis]
MSALDFYGTLGPACCGADTLTDLFSAGMTGVRLNLSHINLADCGAWLANLHEAAARVRLSPRLLIDLRGPELRVGELSAPLALTEGTRATLAADGGSADTIPVPPLIFPALRAGQEVLLDDGALLLRVDTPGDGRAFCTVFRGGILHSRKSIALPGAALRPPTLTQSDLENLSRARANGVTGVMLPFVRDEHDLLTLRRALLDAGAPQIAVFAKLENKAGLFALPRLLPHADHIVVARGDLGNDMPLWELPAAQKRVAAICRAAGKPFMVVTQLLHSMQKAAVPTRAEVCDIFNAVLDGASSLMLTGETAAGAYPVQAMRYLCATASEALHFQEKG